MEAPREERKRTGGDGRCSSDSGSDDGLSELLGLSETDFAGEITVEVCTAEGGVESAKSWQAEPLRAAPGEVPFFVRDRLLPRATPVVPRSCGDAGAAAAAAAAAGPAAGGEELPVQHPLQALAAAQQTVPQRVPGFLSLADIAELQQRVEQIKPDVGMVCRDASGANTLGADALWHTFYLHSDGMFQKTCPELCARIAALARRVDEEVGWELLAGTPFAGGAAGPAEQAGAGAAAAEGESGCRERINVRCVEYHEYWHEAALCQREHFDRGSLITVGMMLSSTDEFEGGAFQTLEADGTMKAHQYEQGDALVFVSHKYHCVAPVTNGRRNVMIMELWKAPERTCAHRCTEPEQAECPFTVHASYVDRMRAMRRR